MGDYYSKSLSAERLRRVYEIASPRVQQYLKAELDYTLSRVGPGDVVLELGCGYGRALIPLANAAGVAFGIDTSFASLGMARKALGDRVDCLVAGMDAARLGFRNNAFDVVVCIQNGVSAFRVDRRLLLEESLRVTKPGGQALFSSYSARLWDDRLDWFESQARAGLVGEIDYDRTGDGEIVCKDGFTATTVGAGEFEALARELGAASEIVEVDESSLFCILRKAD